MPSTKTPSRLLKLKGSRRLNHGKVEPVAEAVTGSLSPPADLSVAERKMWNNVCGRLEGMGILASSDVELLYCYVKSWSTYLECYQAMKRDGPYTENKSGGLSKHPAFQVAKDCYTQMYQISQAFGFTPAARGHIDAAKTPTVQDPKKKGPDRFFRTGS